MNPRVVRRILVILLLAATLSASPWSASSAEAAAGCRPVLVALSARPSTTVGGTPAKGVVTLSCGPTVPIRVVLRAGSGAHVPASVRLTRRTGTFAIRTDKTASARTVSIKASYGGRRRMTHLSVSATCAPTVKTIGAPTAIDDVGHDTAVHYGDRVAVPITLNCAPLAQTRLTVATVPAGLVTQRRVTVPAGSRTPTAPLTVSAAGTNGGIQQGTLRIGAVSTQLTVVPTLVSLTYTPYPEEPIGTATITLTGPAAPDVSLTSNDLHLRIDGPAHVESPPTRALTFPLSAYPVATDTTVTLTAQLGSRTLTTPVLLKPPFNDTSTVQSVGGDDLALGGSDIGLHFDLSNPAPAGGPPISVAVISGPGKATLISAPEEGAVRGHLIVSLPEAADSLPYDTVVQVRAGNSTATHTIHVEPAIASVSSPPPYVAPGQQVTLHVTMKGVVDRDLTAHMRGGPSPPIAAGGITAGSSEGTITFTVPQDAPPYKLSVSPGLGATGMTPSYYPVGLNFTVTATGQPLEPVLSWESSSALPAGGTGELTLDIGAVQLSDLTIALSCDEPAELSVPSSVVVPAGATTVDVPVSDLTTTGGYQAHVTASFETQSVTTTVTVNPPG